MDTDYIKFESNGMVCFYHKSHLDNPYTMERLAKELQEFCQCFFDVGEVSWHDVMGKEEAESFFEDCHFIKHEV